MELPVGEQPAEKSGTQRLLLDYVEFISLVDSPCVPDATVKVMKSSDGEPEPEPEPESRDDSERIIISKRDPNAPTPDPYMPKNVDNSDNGGSDDSIDIQKRLHDRREAARHIDSEEITKTLPQLSDTFAADAANAVDGEN